MQPPEDRHSFWICCCTLSPYFHSSRLEINPTCSHFRVVFKSAGHLHLFTLEHISTVSGRAELSWARACRLDFKLDVALITFDMEMRKKGNETSNRLFTFELKIPKNTIFGLRLKYKLRYSMNPLESTDSRKAWVQGLVVYQRPLIVPLQKLATKTNLSKGRIFANIGGSKNNNDVT